MKISGAGTMSVSATYDELHSCESLQAQDEYERRLKEEVEAKLQKEREIERLVSVHHVSHPVWPNYRS